MCSPQPETLYNIPAQAGHTWRYLLEIRRQLRGQLQPGPINQPSSEEVHRIANVLASNSVLKQLATDAGIKNNTLLCKLACEGNWTGISESIWLTQQTQADADYIQDLFRKAVERTTQGTGTLNDAFYLDLFKVNPITGVIAAFAIPDIQNPNSSINLLVAGRHPKMPEQRTDPVQPWLTIGINQAKAWHKELKELFQMLHNKTKKSPHAQRLVNIMERELIRLWADSVLDLTGHALAILRLSTRPFGEERSIWPTTIYFPLFPRTTVNPELIGRLFENLSPRWSRLFREKTNYFPDGFEDHPTIHVPIPIDFDFCIGFISDMRQFTTLLRTALGETGMLIDKNYKFGTGLKVQFREHTENKAGRVSFVVTRGNFKNFSLRIDFDSIPNVKDKRIATLDFGASDLQKALQTSNWLFDQLSGLPPYRERISEKDQGRIVLYDAKFWREVSCRNHDGSSTQLDSATKLSFFAAAISSAGYLLATIGNEVISHHRNQNDDEMTAAEFNEAVACLRQSLTAFDNPNDLRLEWEG